METTGSIPVEQQEARVPSFCADYGFNPDKPGALYYLRIIVNATGHHYFKIGITNRGVNSRIRQMLREGISLEIINSVSFLIGKEAYDLEQWILREFYYHLYKGPALLRGGNSEIFTKDISEHLVNAFFNPLAFQAVPVRTPSPPAAI